jgi:hypothetical protein
LKAFIFATLFLTSIGFGLISTRAQIQTGPAGLTQELMNVVDSAPRELFQGVDGESKGGLRATLVDKINEVIMMFEQSNYQGGYAKLNRDISPKLNICHTAQVVARSWLSNDPEMRDAVEVFRDTCQDLIIEINLADPRPTP